MAFRFRVLGRVVAIAILFGGALIAAAAGSLVTATPTLAQTASQIVVQGNQRVEAEAIRGHFNAKGGRLDATAIDDGVKALFATGMFEDVRVRQDGARVVVTVVENQFINRVAFEGNKRIKDDVLTAEIQSKSRGPLSRAIVQSDVQRILEVYRRSGRYDIRVDPKIIDRANGRADLIFEINEGSKTTVRKIAFVGNRAFPDWKLKDALTTTETNWLSWLKPTDVYDPDRLNADQELLRRFYLKNGYADFRIVSAAADLNREKNEFTLTIVVDEGERYRFGKVEVQSNVRGVDPIALQRQIRPRAGLTYNAEAVEKTVEELTIEVAKTGHPFSQVRVRGERDVEGRQIAVVFVVDEGARVYVERINIRGNTRTRDYVIRREFDLFEGDAYNRVLIDRAERRLKNLNYFKNVKITSEPGSAPDRVIVNVEVEDMPTGEFSVAGGYSTSDGVIGEVAVAERNFLGRGQFVRLAGSWGQRTKGAEFSFTEPYFLGSRVSAGFDLYTKTVNSSSYTSYKTETHGGGIRFGLPLREDMSLLLRYSIYQQEITIPSEFMDCAIPNPAVTDACVLNGEVSKAFKEVAGRTMITSLVGYTLAYNTLDNNKSPTRGMYADIKQDFAGVGGDVNFIRTSGEIRYYIDLTNSFVLGLKGQGGYVSSWGGKDLRILDHYFMGPNVVRGFASSGLGPRDIAAANKDALGGTTYWGTSAELQFPFSFLPKDFAMKGAIFADAGSVWDYQGKVYTGMDVHDSSTVRTSVGAGLIWESPLGPIRIDYAKALTKDTYDKTQAFRFSGGTKF